MAFIPWPNGVQLCFDFTTAAQLWQFCLALRKSAGAPTVTDLQNVADAAATWWAASFRNGISSLVTLRQTRATDMTAQGAPVRFHTVNQAGANAGVALPNNVAAVISGRTEKRGRSYRGRTYVGGMPASAQSTPTIIDSSWLSTKLIEFGDLQTAMSALNFDMVIASTRHNGVVTSPAELNEIVEWIADTAFDAQRRRLAGRGT